MNSISPLLPTLLPSMPTSTDMNSILNSHLYQYFGMLLGCSHQGTDATFTNYQGNPSMYAVHKYMNLRPAEVTYFIEQVAAAALAYGASPEDVAPVGIALNRYFNYRCLPSETIITTQGSHYQSICSAQDCPTLANATCSASAVSLLCTHLAWV